MNDTEHHCMRPLVSSRVLLVHDEHEHDLVAISCILGTFKRQSATAHDDAVVLP